MAKVRVCVQTTKFIETEIDGKYIRLDIDRSASADQNDTVYMSEFVNGDAYTPLMELKEKLNLDSDSEIISVLDLQTDSLLYDG